MADERSTNATDSPHRPLTWQAAFDDPVEWVAAVQARLPDQPAVASGSASRTRIGLAFELAVGLVLVVDAYQDRIARLPVERAEWIRAQVELYRLAGGHDQVGSLLQAACYMAALDEFVVKYGLWGSAEQALQITTMLIGMDWPAKLWTAAEGELRALWSVHCASGREELHSWGDVVVSVPLQRSTGVCGEFVSAYADLIVGPLLVEIKTGHVSSDWDLRDAYDQLARYARLAPAAGHPITTLGLYLARYGQLLTWPVK
ncbi:hypothetical protein GCM10009682_25200 [Luedemannella flava]|uniref:PD-(D/E)XK endonuclease-like domain-containing protein n=1 Tax=Luedemannella flava TaxID=349316 RepID=A0ABN2LXH7_9ACTN